MTPLHAFLLRYLPPPLALLVLGLCYGIVIIAVIFCVARPSQEFIYL